LVIRDYLGCIENEAEMTSEGRRWKTRDAEKENGIGVSRMKHGDVSSILE
jgi:hypothetical protein